MCQWRCALLSVAVVTVSLWTSYTVEGYQLYMYVNNPKQPQPNASTVSFPVRNTDPIIIVCQYDFLLRTRIPHLVEYVSGIDQPVGAINNVAHMNISYSVPSTKWQGVHLYKCVDFIGEFVSVTISFENVPLTSEPLTTRGVTSAAGNTNNAFTGLNPLIYTISAVIFLGTLAVVAIITCWVRARRSFNNRSLRSAQTPQDYFDTLSDSEFTPLTSEEFQASLQERPPTYHQSEELEAQPITSDGCQANPTESAHHDSSRQPLPSEEDAIVENLIALNLLPESEARAPRRQRGNSGRTTGERRETVRGRTPTVDHVDHLREVGEQAQRLLETRQSSGTLIQLDTATDTNSAETANHPTPEQSDEIQTTVNQFNSRISDLGM